MITAATSANTGGAPARPRREVLGDLEVAALGQGITQAELADIREIGNLPSEIEERITILDAWLVQHPVLISASAATAA